MILRLVIFLLINFAALGIGSYFTGVEVKGDWYLSLNKAPWTPPGWVFGAAWTLIMICFSLYMASLWDTTQNTKIIMFLFVIQWILNVGWNPTFFYFHQPLFGLIVIIALTILVGFLMFNYWSALKMKSLLIAPYFLWLLIATSLNAYIVFKN